jgi:hypothetical protein
MDLKPILHIPKCSPSQVFLTEYLLYSLQYSQLCVSVPKICNKIGIFPNQFRTKRHALSLHLHISKYFWLHLFGTAATLEETFSAFWVSLSHSTVFKCTVLQYTQCIPPANFALHCTHFRTNCPNYTTCRTPNSTLNCTCFNIICCTSKQCSQRYSTAEILNNILTVFPAVLTTVRHLYSIKYPHFILCSTVLLNLQYS